MAFIGSAGNRPGRLCACVCVERYAYSVELLAAKLAKTQKRAASWCVADAFVGTTEGHGGLALGEARPLSATTPRTAAGVVYQPRAPHALGQALLFFRALKPPSPLGRLGRAVLYHKRP